MPKQDFSSRHFQQKISKFCEVRIAPVASQRTLENIKTYLISLIIDRRSPPLLNGRIDWTAIVDACGIGDELTADLKKQFRSALDAMIRWLGAPPVVEDTRLSNRSTRSNVPDQRRPMITASSTA